MVIQDLLAKLTGEPGMSNEEKKSGDLLFISQELFVGVASEARVFHCFRPASKASKLVYYTFNAVYAGVNSVRRSFQSLRFSINGLNLNRGSFFSSIWNYRRKALVLLIF